MSSVALDKNFEINTAYDESVKFYDAEKKPFTIYGIFREEGRDQFSRMPDEAAKSTSVRVSELNYNTAGGRVRFRTDSAQVVINAITPEFPSWTRSLFSNTGAQGFDLYEETEDEVLFLGTFVAPREAKSGYESIIKLGEKKTRNLLINFPPYGCVNKLYIGLDADAITEEPIPYKNVKPIVYYGSSITQGGCVSKPGDSYENIISRRFGVDYINLGFAGNAKAEVAMGEYVSNLDMSIFVYDYDHNAPSPAYLEETHERFFLQVREKNPDLPIVMMSRPRYIINPDTKARLEVIKKTYNNAIARGDKNVYLLTGPELMAICKNEGMVEGVHPTSLGFFSMGVALGGVIEKIIKERGYQ